MKRILASVLSLILFSNVALADSHDEQVDLELEAAALVQIAEGSAPIEKRSFLGLDLANPFGFLTTLKDQVENVKETLLVSFDENGNGRIDPGTEFENFQVGVKAIIMVVADTNTNGKIDVEDVGALSKVALERVEEQALATLCPIVYKQVEISGSFLIFRPLLRKFNDICLDKGIGTEAE